MIPKDKGIRIKCGWCSLESPIEKWEQNTFKECKTREMKRAYETIYDEKVFRGDNYFYLCPECNTWSSGEQLRITGTKDKHLLQLGGKEVYKKKK